jgi:hypothetical protein
MNIKFFGFQFLPNFFKLLFRLCKLPMMWRWFGNCFNFDIRSIGMYCSVEVYRYNQEGYLGRSGKYNCPIDYMLPNCT